MSGKSRERFPIGLKDSYHLFNLLLMTDVEMEPAPEIKDQDRLKIAGDLHSATFSFYDEDHTLGNLLRN